MKAKKKGTAKREAPVIERISYINPVTEEWLSPKQIIHAGGPRAFDRFLTESGEREAEQIVRLRRTWNENTRGGKK
jgi:hypothetical protein